MYGRIFDKYQKLGSYACLFVVYCCSHCGGSVFAPCFVVHYVVSFLVLQSTWRERERDREREREREREQIALLCLSFQCLMAVIVMWLLHSVLWVGFS